MHCTRALEAGFPTRRNVMRSGGGKVLGELPLGTPLADGTPALTMKRSQLTLRLIEEAEQRGIVVEHGRRLIDTALVDNEIRAAVR